MTTRQNNKRKGRGGTVARERTYTTLTGTPLSLATTPGSMFLPTTATTALSTDESAAIMSSPFPVASSAGGSPNYQPYDFSNPIHILPNPNYHNGFAAMQSVGTSNTYGQQQSQSQLQQPFYHPQPPQQQHQQPKAQSANNDLELLEKLKETIKNNQHDIFRPVPQPVTLASLYLGPPSSSSSLAPHPDHGHADRQLGHQGEYESSRDVASGAKSGSNGVSQPRGRRGSEVWDGSRRPVAYGNGTQGPSTHTATGPQRYDDKAMDVDHSRPPGLGTSSVPPRRDFHNGRSDRADIPSVSGAPPSPTKTVIHDNRDDPRPPRDRDSVFGNRYATSNLDDNKAPIRNDRDRRPGSPDSRYNDNRGRFYDRDRDRERDKDLGPNWDRDRPRERDDRRPFENRYVGGRDFDRDRRSDDRFSRYSDTRRPYDSRYAGNSDTGLKRYDTKSSINDSPLASHAVPANTPGLRADDRDARDHERSGPPDSRYPRPVTEERSFGRYDDRTPRQLGHPDDRRGPPPPNDRERSVRPDDHHPLPHSSAALGNDRPPPLNDRERRPVDPAPSVRPPTDARRPGMSRPPSPAPSTSTLGPPPGLRPGPPDDRRSPPVDDRRVPPRSGPPAPPSVVSDDHRPPGLSPVVVPVNLPGDRDRVRPNPDSARGSIPPAQEMRPLLADRDRERPPPPAARPSDDRGRDARPPSLEDRLSRPPPPPSLQERISVKQEPTPVVFARPNDKQALPSGTAEDLSSVASTPPSVRDASVRTAIAASSMKTDTRPPTSETDATARPAGAGPPLKAPTPTSTAASSQTPRPTVPPASTDEPCRPGVDDRQRTASGPPPPDRERMNSGPPPPRSYNGPPARVPEDRSFKPRSSPVSPSRRDFRPPYRPSQEHDRRPDSMDVDGPPYPPGERPPVPFRRPSPGPPHPRDRAWAPNDAYPADGRRHPPDSIGGPPYSRDWRDDERGAYSRDWNRGPWDRERDRSRDGPRYPDREPGAPPVGSHPPPVWETRDERERRVSYGSGGPPDTPLPSASSTRSFETRPLSARLTDGYPPPVEDRDRDRDSRAPYSRDYSDRRYAPPPPIETDAPYNRIRPRSPSPVGSRRPGPDDMRPPPPKRARDEEYVGGSASGNAPGRYYPPPPPPSSSSAAGPPASGLDSARAPPPDYGHHHLAARMRSPPAPGAGPGGGGGGGYYDAYDSGRERDRVDDGPYGGYDRDRARMPLPPRSPPLYGRPGGYRDDRYIPRR
ncbi:hypothetical protein BXZ70DRAFT_356 [Cristinia sonorae]|uniref:Uncharacterized protein n=1 Tax=Cristinia sonorae TaxID=1940300 RepID=A0A8K0UZ72_9AGAR|nr:hypothetical protein BXZ70DRAFT_356 [Cristinia sonorae]